MKSKIIDKFTEWLLERPLLEEASERNEKMMKIQEMSNTLNEHLFKLYMFQKSKFRHHWEGEIENYLYRILNFYWGKKHNRFKIENYYNWLFYDFFHDDDGELRDIKRIFKTTLLKYSEGEEQLKNWSNIEFYNICNRFYNIICPMLEKGKLNLEQFDEIIKIFEIE